jgi:hypothetical protein
MAYAGMATATGQHLEIPIILRSLVTSLSLIPKADLPVPFDSAFIALLEVGTSDEEFGRVVRTYAATWWNKKQKPAASSLLNANNIHKCLDHHQEQLLKSNEPRKRLEPRDIEVTVPYQIPEFVPRNGSDGADGAGFQPVTIQIGSDAPVIERCEHCAKNNCKVIGRLCATLFAEIQATHRFLSAMAVTSQGEVAVAARRCAGFYRLHERVQKKELLSESITMEGTGRGTEIQKTSRRVTEIAAGELERYRAMPSSAKWTWGETLTKDEVLALKRVSKQDVRTGYGTDLPPGILSGEYSATNTAPTTNANFSTLPGSVKRVPTPTSLLFPSNVGSYGLNSDLGASDDAGTELMDEDGDQSDDEEDDAASAAAALWESVAGSAEVSLPAVMEVDEEEEEDGDDDASIAADLWPQSAAGAADAAVSTGREEYDEQYDEEGDEDDAASAAADLWPDGAGMISSTDGAGMISSTDGAGMISSTDGAGGAMESAPSIGEGGEEEDSEGDDAASIAADMWPQSETGCADAAVPTRQEEEEEKDEEEGDKDDAASEAADSEEDDASMAADLWVQAAAGAAEASVLTREEQEDDEEDDDEDNDEDNEEDDDEDEEDGDSAASAAADMWPQSAAVGAGALVPLNGEHEEDNEEDDTDDAASVAADLWLPGDGTQSLAGGSGASALTTEDISQNAHPNASALPRLYTPADFPNEWLEDDEDAEHEVDLGIGDLHLVD